MKRYNFTLQCAFLFATLGLFARKNSMVCAWGVPGGQNRASSKSSGVQSISAMEETFQEVRNTAKNWVAAAGLAFVSAVAGPHVATADTAVTNNAIETPIETASPTDVDFHDAESVSLRDTAKGQEQNVAVPMEATEETLLSPTKEPDTPLATDSLTSPNSIESSNVATVPLGSVSTGETTDTATNVPTPQNSEIVEEVTQQQVKEIVDFSTLPRAPTAAELEQYLLYIQQQFGDGIVRRILEHPDNVQLFALVRNENPFGDWWAQSYTMTVPKLVLPEGNNGNMDDAYVSFTFDNTQAVEAATTATVLSYPLSYSYYQYEQQEEERRAQAKKAVIAAKRKAAIATPKKGKKTESSYSLPSPALQVLEPRKGETEPLQRKQEAPRQERPAPVLAEEPRIIPSTAPAYVPSEELQSTSSGPRSSHDGGMDAYALAYAAMVGETVCASAPVSSSDAELVTEAPPPVHQTATTKTPSGNGGLSAYEVAYASFASAGRVGK